MSQPRFSLKNLQEKLNNYIPTQILNYEMSHMPSESKKSFDNAMQTQPPIRISDYLDQDRDIQQSFHELDRTFQNQLKSIKLEYALHFLYNWIIRILRHRLGSLLQNNILDDLHENSSDQVLFERQFMYLDLCLGLVTQMNVYAAQSQITNIQRIIIYDTYQILTSHYLGFVKKFSKFLLAQQGVPVFQVNEQKLVRENFFLWLIKYFEELTKLLNFNEKLNMTELQRVLDYVYCYLTVELLIFAYLSEQEMQSEQQQTLQITFELIQEPFKRFQDLFFSNHKYLDELCKIEAMFSKPFIWNHLLALTIFKKSNIFPTLALHLYDNFEEQLDQSNGHFYHLMYRWLYFLFFTEISSKLSVSEEINQEMLTTIYTHINTLKHKQRYVIDFLQQNNKEFTKIQKKLIKKTIHLNGRPEFDYLNLWVQEIKGIILSQQVPSVTNQYWITYQKAVLSLDKINQEQLDQMILEETPMMLANLEQVGALNKFNLEKSLTEVVALFNNHLIFYPRIAVIYQEKMLEILGRFFKYSLNFILKSETIIETLLSHSTNENTSSVFFCLISNIMESFDQEGTNRFLVLNFIMKLVAKAKVVISTNVNDIILEKCNFDKGAQHTIFILKLVAYVIRVLATMGLGDRSRIRVLNQHQSHSKEVLFKRVQQNFNLMSLNDTYNLFYENIKAMKIQAILMQNRIYMEMLIEFVVESTQHIDKIPWPAIYDARSFILMLTKEIVNLEYAICFNDETHIYYNEDNAMRIHQLVYQLCINTVYLIKEKAYTIDFKDQVFHLLNQLMNISVGNSFHFQIERQLFYDENRYIKNIDKDISKKLNRFLEKSQEEVRIFFYYPKVFELILSILFEAPSDNDHKCYILNLLNLILSQSIQATLQVQQILPKFILHLRLESNEFILRMMSDAIQKIMFLKSDITCFKALFQALGYLPSVLLRPLTESKAIAPQVQRIEELLQQPDYMIPIFNIHQRRVLTEILENDRCYGKIMKRLIDIIKKVIENNFGRQNQLFFTGQQSGIQMKCNIPLKKNPKTGLSFQLVFQLKFEKTLFSSAPFHSSARSMMASNIFTSSASLYPPMMSMKQIIYQMSNDKVNLEIYFLEENDRHYLVIATTFNNRQTLLYNFEMPFKKDFVQWLFIQVIYQRKEFYVFLNHQRLKLTRQAEQVDLSTMATIDEINLGQDAPRYQMNDMDPTRSQSQSLMDMLHDMPDDLSDLNGLLEQSSLSNAFVDSGSNHKLPFSGQMQVFYLLNGGQDTDYQLVQTLFKKCKSSKILDEEIEKQFKEQVLVKLNLNMIEYQNMTNYKQFLDPNYIEASKQSQSVLNPSNHFLIVNQTQKIKEAETVSLMQQLFARDLKSSEIRKTWNFSIDQRGVFYLDSYSIYDILIQFGQHEMFYFVILIIFTMEQDENGQHNDIYEDTFRQTIMIIQMIIENFKEQNIVQTSVEETINKAYNMINFMIEFYLRRGVQILDQKQTPSPYEIYTKIFNKQKEIQQQLKRNITISNNHEAQFNVWKSLYRKMTSQIGLWYYLNEDHQNLRIYLSNLILSEEQNLDTQIAIPQSKYKFNNLEDKLRRKFFLKVDKKWSNKPYSLNNSTNQTQNRSNVEDSNEQNSNSPSLKTPPLRRLNSNDSNRMSGRRVSVCNMGPSYFQSTSVVQSNTSLQSDEQKPEQPTLEDEDTQHSQLLQQQKPFSKVHFDAEWITPKGGYFGSLILTDKAIIFESKQDKPDESKYIIGCVQENLITHIRKKKSIQYSQILEVFERRFLLFEVGAELFTKNGKSYFFNFFHKDKRTQFFRNIETAYPKRINIVQNRKQVFKQKGFTDRWLKGEISNFHYLVLINNYSGRSFNDISQYFVFPWVLSEYDNEEIKLKSQSIYRELGKPIGAQVEARIKQLRDNYDKMAETDEEANQLYGQHYSHSTLVLNYLMRLEPFAILHHQLQGGKFDIPDRLFHSVKSLWETSLTQDYKELIPEFFFMPEFLKNKNQLNLGLKQNQDKVDDVDLPRWVKTRTPEEFVFIMRQSLENSNVSKNLHKWIDLIFGYLNELPKALEADNLFRENSYEKNVQKKLTQSTSRVEQRALLSQVTYYGQTPSQLFESGHAQRTDYKGQIFQDFNWHLDMTSLFHDVKTEVLAMYHAAFVGVYTVHKDYTLHFISWDKQISAYIIMNDSKPKLKKESVSLGEPICLFQNPHSILCFMANDMQPIYDYHALRDFSISNQYKSQKNTIVLVAVGGYQDNSFRIYSTKSQQWTIRKFHKRLVTCLQYCPIDKLLVVGSSDCRLSVWQINIESSSNVIAEQPMHILYGHHNQITAVQVSGTLNIIVSADWNGMILIHHTLSGRLLSCIRQELGIREAIIQLAIHEGGFIVTRSTNSLINVFTLNGAKYINNWSFEDNEDSITRMVILSPLQAQFLLTTFKGKVLICDIFNIKYNQDSIKQRTIMRTYKDYETVDLYQMKMHVGGDELHLKEINKQYYSDFNQRISACWINIEIEVKYSNLILMLAMQDGKVYVFQNQDQCTKMNQKALQDLKRIQAGFRSLGL